MADLFFSKSPARRVMWIDLEMTDIADVDRGRIMEVGLVFTGPTMEMLEVEESSCAPVAYHRVVSLTEEELDASSTWSKHTHSVQRSPHSHSLFDLCRRSRFTIAEIDAEVAGLVRAHARGRPMIIAGSSISCDRIFIHKHMPLTAALLHHRMIDVSTILELTRRMYPGIRFSHFAEHDKQHSAMSDIFSSLHLMHNLQSTVFMPMISTPSPTNSAPPPGLSSNPSSSSTTPTSSTPSSSSALSPPGMYYHPVLPPGAFAYPSPQSHSHSYPPHHPYSTHPPPGQHHNPYGSTGPSSHSLIVRQSISLTPHLMEACIAAFRTDDPTALYCFPFPVRIR